MVGDVCAEFRKYNPDSQIQVNIAEPINNTHPMTIYDFCKWVQETKPEIDRIGIQLYYNGFLPWGQPMMHAGLEQHAELFKRLGETGIDFDITEFAVPSKGSPYPGWEWTPERQADFIEAIYTLAFGTHNFKSLTYFSTQDRFIKDSGLIDPDLQPRPAFHRLEKLINSWTTSGTSSTNTQGTIHLKGFGGTYRIQARYPATGINLTYITEIIPQSSKKGILTPIKIPRPAPEPLVNTGPEVHAEHVLEVSFKKLEDSANPSTVPNNFLTSPVTPVSLVPKHFPLETHMEDSHIQEKSFGVFIAPAPKDVREFRCILEVVSQKGIPLSFFQAIVGTRRFLHQPMTPGKYFLSVPLSPGETLYLRGTPPRLNKDASLIIHSPRYVLKSVSRKNKR
jgi:hypothetical protein